MAEAAEAFQGDFSDAAPPTNDVPTSGYDPGPAEAAAARTRRGAAHDVGSYGIPTISSQEEAERLRPGQQFKGPDGSLRTVPYKVMEPSDLNNVPDGADFVGPDGELRVKPKYQSVDFTAQYLYNVAHSDKGRRKALERSYPGKVRDDPAGGFFVEDENGVLRKPGRGPAASGGGIASAAAPTVLGIGGAVGGGLAGGLPGVAGAFAGGAAGSKVNDIVSSLAGVYDAENSWRDAAVEGGLAAGGQVLGHAAAVVAPAAKQAYQSGKRVLPSIVNSALGTDPEKLTFARKLAEKGETEGEGWLGRLGIRKAGVQVPPSQIYKEAPALHNIVEVKEPALHTQKPLKQSAEAHYERSVGEILEELHVGKPMSRTEIDRTFKELVAAQEAGNIPLVEKLEDILSRANVRSATHPDAAVSVEAAGNRILESVRAKSAESDQRLKDLLELRKADAERRSAVSGESHAARTAELRAAQEAAQRDAQALIDQGFADLDRQSADALRVARAGHNSGDLWRSVGEQLQAYRTGIQARARIMYDTADELSGAVRNPATGMMEGGARVNAEGLAPRAQAFLDQLPEEFERNHPVIVQRIRALGNADEAPTWAQLHDLRTMLRQNIKWNDLTSDVKNGTYKYFNNRVNELLHDSSKEGGRLYYPKEWGFVVTERTPRNVFNLPSFDRPAYSFKVGPFEMHVEPITKDSSDYLVSRVDRSGFFQEDNTGKGFAPAVYQRVANFLSERNAKLVPGAMGGPDYLSPGGRSVLDRLKSAGRIGENGTIVADSANTGSIREASAALNDADVFYRANMGPLGNKEIQNVMNALDSGLQADPKALLNLIMKEGKTEVAQQIERIVGANTWNALRAADTQEMIQTSRDIMGTVDSKKFAREVLKRQNQGLLGTLHGPQAERLVQQAQRIEQLAGRAPISAQPGDTVGDVIMRARAAADAAQEAAKKDPFNTLKQEMAGIRKEHAAAAKAAKANDPMSFMLDPTVGAHAAVDRILASPDMLVAASRAFAGAEASPEFELIRQVYAQRFLQGSTNLSDKLSKVTPEIQSLMFPGVTLKQMQLLAKEMDILVSNKAGAFGNSLMGTNIVEHPIGAATGLGKLAGPTKMLPGANLAARSALGSYYGMVRELVTSPTTMRWLEKGLTASDPAARAQARAAMQQLARKYEARGAGMAAGAGTFGPGEANE